MMRYLVFVVFCLATTVGLTSTLEPFLISFDMIWQGMTVGSSTLELRAETASQWRYTSRSNARGLFKIFLSGKATQISYFEIDQDIIRPIKYQADDGTEDTVRDIKLDFNWAENYVRGISEKNLIDLPLKAGIQDNMTAQISLMVSLKNRQIPQAFSLVDKNIIKDYQYYLEGEETLNTSIGKLSTVIYSSRRTNSKRSTHVWYAPSLGYLPVQAKQYKDKNLEWMMRLKN
ncbi:MAG: DUF3108 domain-containing protein [Gammaproteobacteria bacterium]|nr:DUF3108 domain-containing protein [Gammaproteobacteria bacterium]